MSKLPGFGPDKGSQEIDLVILGETIVKHIIHIRMRDGKAPFHNAIIDHFYEKPVTRFGDELHIFKNNTLNDSSNYNDALLFVMGITADLIRPEEYFKKMLDEYQTIINNMPNKQLLQIDLKPNNYFDCVFFAIRFFIDQEVLLTGLRTDQAGA